MEIDPVLTSLHYHDVNLNFRSFNWGDLSKHCRQLADSLDHYLGELVDGFCALKRGDTLRAKSQFENLLQIQPRDGILRGLITATLVARGESDAKEALAFKGDLKQKKLLADVIMRGCLQASDLACAQEVDKSLGNRVNILYQYWYKTERSLDKKSNEARNALSSGLDSSHRFKPLLKLRQNMLRKRGA